MPTVTQHAPGTFCWPELATTDAKAALAFYSGLFGWTVRESTTDMGPYYVALLAGREAAAMYELPAAMREQHVPPHWGAYVSVVSAAEAATVRLSTGPPCPRRGADEPRPRDAIPDRPWGGSGG